MGVNISELARILGVTPKAVRKARDTGRITAEADGTFDVEAVKRDWADNTDASQQRKPQPSTQTFNAAKTEREKLRLERERVEFAALQRTLVDRGQVKAMVFNLARQYRDGLTNWPARAAAEIAAELGADPRKTLVVLEQHVRRLLDEQSAEPDIGPGG